MLYVTRGLVETLLRLAAEKDPDSVTIPVAVTKAAELPDVGLSEETPVFTHFYLPNEGDALNAVFGVDLVIPARQTPGIFISHPRGDLRVSRRDDLREAVFIAVPPWDEQSMKAFDRSGTRQDYTVLDVEPPDETVPS